MRCRVHLVLLAIFGALGGGHGFAPRANLANPHIIGGEEVDIAKVPYVASIRRVLNSGIFGIKLPSKNSELVCGASIVSKSYVLTAAHCFLFSKKVIWYEVSAGTNHRDEGRETYEVRSISLHPDYNSKTEDYDVAVVGIATDFNFGKKTAPIGLVDVGNLFNSRNTMVVSGWGLTEKGFVSEKLLKTELRYVDQLQCIELYADVVRVTERMFCAGEVDRDACNGDSGGPIVNSKSGKQIGVVSWGLGCGDPKRPGVYTRLSHPKIRKFIDAKIKT